MVTACLAPTEFPTVKSERPRYTQRPLNGSVRSRKLRTHIAAVYSNYVLYVYNCIEAPIDKRHEIWDTEQRITNLIALLR